MLIATLALLSGAAVAADGLVIDLTQFFTDGDKAAAAEASAAADRLVIATDVNAGGGTTLQADVTQFFKDHDMGVHQERKRISERHQLYFDLARTRIKFTKPTTTATDLASAVKQFFTDYDIRAAARDAVDNDLINWRVSLTTNDTAGLTSNGNKFFDDRHTLIQDRLNVRFDVAVMRKITKHKADKPAIPKLNKSMDLLTAAKNFTTARANWDTAKVTLDTAITNLRAAQGGSSLDSAVIAFLDARHNRHVTGLLLNAARYQMRFSAGLIKSGKEPEIELPKPPKTPKGKKPANKGENEAADDSSSGQEGSDPDAE
jgi:hypothetical protein